MNFLELASDATRQNCLDYSAICTLVEYQKYISESRVSAAIGAATGYDYAKLKQLLGELYPTVIFSGEGYTLTAEVRPETDGTLAEQFGILTPQTHYLKANYDPSGSNNYQLIFRADGIGIIIEEYNACEFFNHELDLAEIEDKYKGDPVATMAIENDLIEYFDEEIGIELDDPFFDPDDESRPVEFVSGSEAELGRIIKLFILTELNIEEHEGERVRIYAATDEDDMAQLCNDDDDCYWSERLDKLTDLALAENSPVGWTYEYNDGAYDRRSGYSRYAESLHYEIGDILEVPARERMRARRELRQWLAARGRTLEEFDKKEESEAISEATSEVSGASAEEVNIVEASTTIETASGQSL